MLGLRVGIAAMIAYSITLFLTGTYMVTFERTTDIATARHYVSLAGIGLLYVSVVIRILTRRGIKPTDE
jgi:hypothetical protein